MKKSTAMILLVSHVLVGAAGFGLGIYALPILIAPEAPTVTEVMETSADAVFSGVFRRDLADSDALHWGDGEVFVGAQAVTFMGRLAPGPDYQLYLAPEFVETEQRFEEIRSSMVKVGPVKTFENFIVEVPPAIDPSRYNTVIVWCETFGEFITAATYQ